MRKEAPPPFARQVRHDETATWSAYPTMEVARATAMATSNWQAGRQLAGGRFEVRRRLGEGAMGVVYEAFDKDRGGSVAVKSLHRLDAASICRVKSEFRSLADVRHTNLVRLHELFAADGWFFSMDLVDGVPFDQWVRGGDVDRLRAALRQLADATHTMHARGKLHRDLKPRNVLVEQGHVVVLDFGLVTDQQSGNDVEDHGTRGTPAYMAPEQARGEAANESSDWYAVGTMLFEALTGRLPFQGSAAQVVEAKSAGRLPDFGGVLGEAPQDLRALCLRMLAPDPAARPAAAEILRSLGATESLRPLEARLELVGRESQLEALRHAYQTSRQGDQPVIQMVSGESGIGKSALVDTFLTEIAKDDVLLLRGRCYERESVPFKAFDVVIDDLLHYLRRLEGDEAREVTPRGAWALTRLFPVLGRVPSFARVPAQKDAEPQEIRRRGFAALGRLLSALRERQPLVLFVDDLQWTDSESMDLLMNLLRRADAPQMLFLGSHRAGEYPALENIYRRLKHDPRLDFRELTLTPLSDPDARSIAGAEAPEDLVAEARGNPFLLSALAREAGPDGCAPQRPRSLREVLQARVASLPQPSRLLLEAIALSEGPVPIEIAARAVGVEPHWLDAACDADLVRRGARRGEVECYHDKVRETVVAGLQGDRRRQLHRALAAAFSEDEPLHLGQRARHEEGAGRLEVAARLAARAAAQAAEGLAFGRAARLYQKALALGSFDADEVLSLRLACADALSREGRYLRAAKLCVEAAGDMGSEVSADVARRTGSYLLRSGRLEEALPWVNRGLSPVGLRVPTSREEATTALAEVRQRLEARGRKPRIGPPDEELLARIRAAEAIETSLDDLDPLRGGLLVLELLLLRLDSGDPKEAAKGLARGLGSTYLTEGAGECVKEADARLACERADDPEAWCWFYYAQSVRDALEGRPSEQLKRATHLIEEHPTETLVHLGRELTLWQIHSDKMAGRFGKLARELPALLDDAWGREDVNQGPLLASLSWDPRVAVEDLAGLREDLRRASEVCDDVGTWQTIHIIAARARLDLYEGFTQRASEYVLEMQRRLEALPSSEMALTRQNVASALGPAALAHAATLPPGPERDAWLEHASRAADELAEGDGYLRVVGMFSTAGLQCLRGDTEAAIATLRSMLVAPCTAEVALMRPIARHRLGALVGGEDGGQLVGEAEAQLRGFDVVDPARFATAFAPGLQRDERAARP